MAAARPGGNVGSGGPLKRPLFSLSSPAKRRTIKILIRCGAVATPEKSCRCRLLAKSY